MDSLTLAISQGSLRRGSAAVYLDVHHPEIEEFLEIRKPVGRLQPQGAQPAPRHLASTDEFMEAVRDGAPFGLRSPKTKEVVARSTPARCGRRCSSSACRPASPI